MKRIGGMAHEVVHGACVCGHMAHIAAVKPRKSLKVVVVVVAVAVEVKLCPRGSEKKKPPGPRYSYLAGGKFSIHACPYL